MRQSRGGLLRCRLGTRSPGTAPVRFVGRCKRHTCHQQRSMLASEEMDGPLPLRPSTHNCCWQLVSEIVETGLRSPRLRSCKEGLRAAPRPGAFALFCRLPASAALGGICSAERCGRRPRHHSARRGQLALQVRQFITRVMRGSAAPPSVLCWQGWPAERLGRGLQGPLLPPIPLAGC